MNIIYLDILFIVNFITDYLTLLCTAKLSGAAIHRIPIIVASVFGGIYACLCTSAELSWINGHIVKIVFAVFICFIVFSKETHFFRCCLIFLAISAIFGGVLSAFIVTIERSSYLPINFKSLIITFLITYFLLSTILQKDLKFQTSQYHTVHIQFRNQHLTLTALHDTGNSLYDPISNLPVLICKKQDFIKLVPELETIPNQSDLSEIYCMLNTSDAFAGKLRFIPFQDISNSGLLIGIKPDHMTVDDVNAEYIVAYSDHLSPKNQQYQAII